MAATRRPSRWTKQTCAEARWRCWTRLPSWGVSVSARAEERHLASSASAQTATLRPDLGALTCRDTRKRHDGDKGERFGISKKHFYSVSLMLSSTCVPSKIFLDAHLDAAGSEVCRWFIRPFSAMVVARTGWSNTSSNSSISCFHWRSKVPSKSSSAGTFCIEPNRCSEKRAGGTNNLTIVMVH